MTIATKRAEVLLVEDDPGDVVLIRESLADLGLNVGLSVTNDGEEALSYLHRKPPFFEVATPDLVLLDLNLPRMSGHEVLVDIKRDPKLQVIPVVVLTTSRSEAEVLRAYREKANCYVSKPVDFSGYHSMMNMIGKFWFGTATLPPRLGS